MTLKTDVVIIGGGVSGLWLLNAFKQRGFKACLLEKNTLGGAQTLASQGMIHGGIKYTLDGFTSSLSETIADMPRRWRACLEGQGVPDLGQVEVLSEHYYLCSDGSLSSRLTSFLGSKAIAGRVSAPPRAAYPAPFSHAAFKGSLYSLQDLVVNTSSLLECLKRASNGHTFQGQATPVGNNRIDYLELDNGQTLEAGLYVLAAGLGNANLLKQIGIEGIAMQTRPLHQVMLRQANLPPVFAHALALKSANKPRVTITTHATATNNPVWYLGGNLAETGVARSKTEQIHFAQQELAEIFPFLDLRGAIWDTLRVDRAEPAQSQQHRPDHPFARVHNNLAICWPTKLTLVPMMVETLLSSLTDFAPANTGGDLPDLPVAPIGLPPWDAL